MFYVCFFVIYLYILGCKYRLQGCVLTVLDDNKTEFRHFLRRLYISFRRYKRQMTFRPTKMNSNERKNIPMISIKSTERTINALPCFRPMNMQGVCNSGHNGPRAHDTTTAEFTANKDTTNAEDVI